MLALMSAACGTTSSSLTADASAARCPVTIPNGYNAVDRRVAGRLNHGNRHLSTVLWPRGILRADRSHVRADGTIGMKFPWFRGVRGCLQITGRRLDAPSPPLRTRVPAGYGNTGLQPTGLVFGNPGCWEVIGRVDGKRLRFVTQVVAPS